MSFKGTLLKNTFLSSISIYTEYALGLICSIIIARTLGPNDYGIYALLIWLSASSIVLINGGINTGQIKFISEFQQSHGKAYTRPIQKYFNKIQLIKTTLVVLVAAIFKPLILETFSLSNYSLYYWIIVAALIFRGRYMFNVSTLKGFQQFGKLAKISLIVTPINLILITLAAIFYKNIEFFIYVYLAVGIIFYFISNHYTKSTDDEISGKIEDKELLGRVNSYIKITSLIVILGYFVSKELELFMLGWLASPEDAGMFRIAMTLSTSILLMIPGVFSSILLPLMSSSLAESEDLAKHRFYESTRILIVLCVPLAIFISIVSSHLIVAIYGDEYQPASIVLSICVIAIGIISITDSAQSYLLSADKQKILLKILLASLLVKLSIGYLLISKYALLGAGITFLVSIIIAYIPRIYLACKYLNCAFPTSTLLRCIFVSILCSLPLFYLTDMDNHYVYLAYSTTLFLILFTIFSLIFKIWTEDDFNTFLILTNKLPTKFVRKYTHLIVSALKKRLY